MSHSKTTTETKSENKIITITAQRTNVPGHKEVDMFINLYKTKAIVKYLLTIKLDKKSTFSSNHVTYTVELIADKGERYKGGTD